MTSLTVHSDAPDQNQDELKNNINSSAYDVGGHSMRLKGFNASGAVMLDVDIADEGDSEPFLFADPAAVEAKPVTDVQDPESPRYTPPDEQRSIDVEGGSGDIFTTALEWQPDSTGLQGEFSTSSGSSGPSDTAGLTLSRAAQRAQNEHAEQRESDVAVKMQREHSDVGHGPFAATPLDPKEGMHCISMLVVGTRGDVQPFLAMAIGLNECGHRVRLATHAIYRKFVEGQGIEFYPLGGDPAVLSEFVVKNRGIIPGSVRDIQEQDEQVRKIVWSCYPACTEPDPERPSRPFKATVIIANPPSIAHCCVAEALQVPLHMMFTMPWTPTKVFPHPMCVVQSVNVAGAVASMPNESVSGAANYYSYHALDMYLFLGFTPQLTKLRRHLKLPAWPNPSTAPAHAITNLKIPFTYLWSPSLQPKPEDWGPHLAVTGFVFLDEDAADYTPPPELTAFLEASHEKPVYIGFGSLVLRDPQETTAMIYEASRVSGKRVLLSSGWAKLGADVPDKPDTVHVLSNCPHSWLFPRCSAAIHHGGAGTTAAGLRAALPTLVVPFFGDQPFWGQCCHRAGVGPKPVPIGKLTKKALLHAFEFFDLPEVQTKAAEVAAGMRLDDGRTAAIDHFHLCLKHRSRIIEPGTYGMNPNAIATMKAFIEDQGKKTYQSIEEVGKSTLNTISVIAGSEPVRYNSPTNGGDVAPKPSIFSRLMCGCGAAPEAAA